MTSNLKPEKLVFLPGAGGEPGFWRTVSERMLFPAEHRLLGWPGFGTVPPRADVNGFDDLVQMVVGELDRPCALVAQSMGGAIALRATLSCPERITHLVLAVTSGGIDMSAAGATDWRPAFFAAHPTLPRWFDTYREDLAPRIGAVTVPTLLLWGDSDAISPLAAGVALHRLLRNSRLHVVAGGGHDLVRSHAAELAPLIDRHLAAGAA